MKRVERSSSKCFSRFGSVVDWAIFSCVSVSGGGSFVIVSTVWIASGEQGEVFPIPLIRQLGSKVTWYVREDPGNPRLRKEGPAKV